MTYSIVARDPANGELGVAVASRWFAVGNVVPWVEPGVGAVATQSFTEIDHGPNGLRLMRAGRSAAEALAAVLAEDPGAPVRQVGMVDATGHAAAHTGAACVRFASHLTADDVAVQANMMERATVPAAMLEAFAGTGGDLASRLLAALVAAESEGGDVRGRQSAALVVAPGPVPGADPGATTLGAAVRRAGRRPSGTARRAGPDPRGGTRLRGDGRGRGGGCPRRPGGGGGRDRTLGRPGAGRRPAPAVARRRARARGPDRRGARRPRAWRPPSIPAPASTSVGSPRPASCPAASRRCGPSASTEAGRRSRAPAPPRAPASPRAPTPRRSRTKSAGRP